MKKKILALILAAAMAVSATACGGGDSSSKNNKKSPEKNDAEQSDPVNPAEDSTQDSEDLTPDLGTTAEPDQEETQTGSLDDLCLLIDLALGDNYSGKEVSYDGNMIVINVWIDGLAMDVAAIQASGGGADNESWVAGKEGTTALAQSICDVIDAAGYDEVSCTLNVLNDANKDNVLLTIFEGTIIYDALA